MSPSPLLPPDIQKTVGNYDLQPGMYHLILEASVQVFRYMVISCSDIWGNCVQPPEEYPEWSQRVTRRLSQSSLPLATEIFVTFGRLVEDEQILLEIEDLLPDFDDLCRGLIRQFEASYGTLVACLPVGELFAAAPFRDILQGILPEGSVLIPAYPDYLLPEYTPDLQGELYQIEHYDPKLTQDYFYYGLKVDEGGNLKRMGITIAGPSTKRLMPLPEWEDPLAIAPGTNEFSLRIDAALPNQKDSVPIFCATYQRTPGMDIKLHFGFNSCSNQPHIRVEGALKIEDIPLRQALTLKPTPKTYLPPQPVTTPPQIAFLLDGGLNSRTYDLIVDQILIPLAKRQMERDGYSLIQLIVFGDRRSARGAQEYQELLPGPQLASCTAFLNTISQSARRPRPFVRPLDNPYRGTAELALQRINRWNWGEGRRILIGMGFSSPYSPQDYPDRNYPVDWEQELKQLQEQGLYMASVYINLHEGDRHPELAAGRAFWQALGSDLFLSFDGAEYEPTLESLDQFLTSYATTRQRYQFEAPIPFPLDQFYWEYPPLKKG